MQAITQARGAAAKLYETIDRVPTIDSSSPDGLKPEKCIGEITLEHVDFNYPSRPNVPIVKDLCKGLIGEWRLRVEYMEWTPMPWSERSQREGIPPPAELFTRE